MLTMRLQRVGKKNQPSYRIVLAEKHRSATKKIVELLGHYNPRTKEFGIKNEERLKTLVSRHIELSATLRNLLITKGLITGEKVKAWRPKIKAKEETPAAAPAVAPQAEAPKTEEANKTKATTNETPAT